MDTHTATERTTKNFVRETPINWHMFRVYDVPCKHRKPSAVEILSGRCYRCMNAAHALAASTPQED